MMKFAQRLSFSLVLFAVSGCGGPVVKFSGAVTFPDGSPVTQGTVCFESENSRFVGRLDEIGRYSPGIKKQGTGIPVGQYKVWLADTSVLNVKKSKNSDHPTQTVAEKYCNADTTPLTFEVKKGGPKTFDFTVERP